MATGSLITETPESSLLEENTVIVVSLDQSGVANEQSIQIEDPFDFDISPFCPSAGLSLDGFFELTSQLITDAQVREQKPLNQRIILTDEYPLENMEALGPEVISYRLISRKPGNMTPDAKGRPQLSFRYSYSLRSPKYPDKVIIVESRPLDHVIEFSCWAKRARIANQRALWLERLLINQTWAYQYKGVDKFYFEDRLADTYYNVGGQPLYQRPLRFFVRLYEYRPKLEPVISNISYVSSTR